MNIINYMLAIFAVIIFSIGPILMTLFFFSMLTVVFMTMVEDLKKLLQARK